MKTEKSEWTCQVCGKRNNSEPVIVKKEETPTMVSTTRSLVCDCGHKSFYKNSLEK